MAFDIKLFNIPLDSTYVTDVKGKEFHAAIFKTPDGQVAVLVERNADATDADLGKEGMNTKIREAAIKHAGSPPDFYSMRRVRRTQ
ncbi:hypothetical protein [Sorangium sp. So ce176]|uniref:hypothetical protein n=1 Tax=Sorangium sp. So ce176 TaxID=3133286 RepID=UPI003F5F4140